jgi:hypothetical protein
LEKSELQSIKSGVAKSAISSNRSMKKESVVIDEAKWEKINEKAKSGHYLYKCLR